MYRSKGRNSKTTIVEDFKKLLSIMSKPFCQKTNKEIGNLTNTMNQAEIRNIHGTLYQAAE